jgi:hypothetical protein
MLPKSILNKIDNLERRVESLEKTPQPPNIGLTDDFEASFSVGANASVTVTVTNFNANNKRLLSLESFSVFKNSISGANLFPVGANWSTADTFNLDVFTWIDWSQSDNNNVILRVLVRNWNASSINLLIHGNFRYLLNSASV